MPTLCFFPWATITEPLRFGDFHLLSFGEATASGEIPADLAEAAVAVLTPYRKRRVDMDAVPLLRQEGRGFVADLEDAQVVDYFDYFDFRTRLAFAVLAAREFFTFRYANSDHLRLVVQGFTPEQAGGAAIPSRRRDGSHTAYVSREMRSVSRPEHVNGACELPRDLDGRLLTALEAAHAKDDKLAARIADAVRLFVGANTDSPDVSPHMELIDIVSAFGRLADAWERNDVARAFVRDLPTPSDPEWEPRYGPRAADAKFVAARERRSKKAPPEKPPVVVSIRQLWLEDAHDLRHQHAHGHIHKPYQKLWTLREHLLLSAVALPLYVKALLRLAGDYAFTHRDEALDLAFDTLATVEPFAEYDLCDPKATHPWGEAFGHAEMYGFIRRAADKITVTEERDADGMVVRTEVSFPTELPDEE